MSDLTKTFNDVTTVTEVNNETVPLIGAAGAMEQITVPNLKNAMLEGMDLKMISDNIRILCHKSNGYPYAVEPHKWSSLQAGGETADGVVLIEGGRVLVIAPTEASALKWSSAAVSGGGVATSSYETALADWAGKTNTVSQIGHTECQGDTFAPGFCNAYARTNAHGGGIAAGKWWLPSLGELLAIYANKNKINYALSLISGAKQLGEGYYWSSTECSSSRAWAVHFGAGGVYFGDKYYDEFSVRPVSALSL